VLAQARAFLLFLVWSLVPMYVFQMLKQYCEAMNTAWLPMVILAGGMLLNASLNLIFIFGHLGSPAFGLVGAGIATLITRIVIVLVLGVIMSRLHFRAPAVRRALFHGSFAWPGYQEMLGLGLPSGLQVVLEVGAFTVMALMMGWISEVALAAQQVVVSVISTGFMVPLGISMAVAIRVSHAIGSKDLARARASVWSSLLLTVSFMGLVAVFVCTFSHGLASLFVKDPKVIALAAEILLVAGFFQVFDGTHIVCVGALRGFYDVRFPTTVDFFGYWFLALPVSYLLAFHFHLGAVGVWLGSFAGVATIAVILCLRLRSVLGRMSF